MHFPEKRMRRLRRNGNLRRMVRETRLAVDDLIFPLFVCPGSGIKQEIGSMPGNYRFSIDRLADECREVEQAGIPGVILFGIPEYKDETGSASSQPDGIIQRAVAAVKKATSELQVITDVCLCEYTTHGHCGVIKEQDVDNDATLKLLAEQALSHARAGADMVAPSDMMDGRIAAIRKVLDAHAFSDLPIMSYAAKYTSAFYGPFRDAASSAPSFGDRSSYQMDPANSREALREVELDRDEGADIVMVKPALAYLDIIYRVKQEINLPLAAYNVSGEFSCIKAAAHRGFCDGERLMWEILTAIKRAGADIILTYFAREAAAKLKNARVF